MNYCSKGHFIPNNVLTCPTCTTEASDEALRGMQVEFLRKAKGGDVNYTLRVARGGDRHVLMYSSFTRTFCGKELKSKPRIGYELFTSEALSNICSGCRVEIKRALEGVQC